MFSDKYKIIDKSYQTNVERLERLRGSEKLDFMLSGTNKTQD
jgi:hypothetical protein